MFDNSDLRIISVYIRIFADRCISYVRFLWYRYLFFFIYLFFFV